MASQAPLAAKCPEGRLLSPTPYFRSRMAFSTWAWRRWSASSSRVSPRPVSDEGVIAVVGKQGQLGSGRGPDPSDDEPKWSGAGLTLERCVFGFGPVGPALHPVGDGLPGRFGYGLYEIAEVPAQADGDGEADIRLAADLDHGVGIEAAVSPSA